MQQKVPKLSYKYSPASGTSVGSTTLAPSCWLRMGNKANPVFQHQVNLTPLFSGDYTYSGMPRRQARSFGHSRAVHSALQSPSPVLLGAPELRAITGNAWPPATASRNRSAQTLLTRDGSV